MCNCGNKRNQFSSQQTFKTNDTVRTELLQKKMWPDVSFAYMGKTALTTKGNITGKNYRFNYPGDVQSIDYRDATSMMTIPVLKRVYK
ncbi:hypothetical protein FW778_12450 [Ginsengibacter hankyongi]|uniref:Uncharacterized protein n=1 Tax=Ginsengibacter hankyongi TaxID=2607284 RepID=A0A5J5II30_9BACT|nr:hypothetical protein [Ginsengibacter hankyongi]KAA9038377.1 hypothetical protein FW778_12450 [Ginsengibacter hankyongi]